MSESPHRPKFGVANLWCIVGPAAHGRTDGFSMINGRLKIVGLGIIITCACSIRKCGRLLLTTSQHYLYVIPYHLKFLNCKPKPKLLTVICLSIIHYCTMQHNSIFWYVNTVASESDSHSAAAWMADTISPNRHRCDWPSSPPAAHGWHGRRDDWKCRIWNCRTKKNVTNFRH